MLDTRPLLLQTDFPPIRRGHLHTLQVNLGYLCNLSCTHCHVNAGPTRKELMPLDVINSVIDFIRQNDIQVLDLTGGAPEMNPHFRYLVQEARSLGVEVIDRCNLIILNEPGYEDLASFLAEQEVTVTASLPCYLEKNVERQRGKGIYDGSMVALRKLNALGYGVESGLQLNLVYNPQGLNLPPSQVELEQDYKRELKQRYQVLFNQLFTITNMPISRFGGMLLSKGWYEQYMTLLKENFSDDNLETVMCRNLLSIDYRGYIYDCDFNQMLDMPLIATSNKRPHISEYLQKNVQEQLLNKPIAIGEHCFGCTAGQGSSCGGALSE